MKIIAIIATILIICCQSDDALASVRLDSTQNLNLNMPESELTQYIGQKLRFFHRIDGENKYYDNFKLLNTDTVWINKRRKKSNIYIDYIVYNAYGNDRTRDATPDKAISGERFEIQAIDSAEKGITITLKNNTTSECLNWKINKGNGKIVLPIIMDYYYKWLENHYIGRPFTASKMFNLPILGGYINSSDPVVFTIKSPIVGLRGQSIIYNCIGMQYSDHNDAYISPYLIFEDSLCRQIAVKIVDIPNTTNIRYGDYSKSIFGDIMVYDIYMFKKSENSSSRKIAGHAAAKYQATAISDEVRIAEILDKATEKLLIDRLKQVQYKEECVARFGRKYGYLISEGKVSIGMTQEMCRSAWGSPSDISQTIMGHANYSVWWYGSRFLSFENDRLVMIQN